VIHENSQAILEPVAPECREAVVRLAREISRRTRLELTVTEHRDPDFALEGRKTLCVEAVLASVEQNDPLAGCNVLEDAPEPQTDAGGSVTGHYLRNLEAVARNPPAARAVLEKLKARPGTTRKGRRKRSARTRR